MTPDEAADIFEVSTNISKEELKKKFKKLVMKYHPDRNKEDTTKKFIQIKEAYEVLFKYIDPDVIPVWQGSHFANLNNQGFNITSTSTTFTITTGY